MKILLTGAAGFIGMHTASKLLARGDTVTALDDLNGYYDVTLKEARLARLMPHANFTFARVSLEDRAAVEALFAREKPERVIHLAAQAGVRYSLENPHAYIESNIQGFMHILDGCRQHQVEALTYASSSSVYGGSTATPFSEHQNVDHPVSLYAATKKANELMAHTYSHLYQIPTTGLRFFTVYGPWGRPDMAPIVFARAIIEGRPLDVFNNGEMMRDFTYIDDIVEGVIRVNDRPAEGNPNFDRASPDPATSYAPYRIFNIGNSEPVKLMDFIGALEAAIGRTAPRNYLPMQPGDVPVTAADTKALEDWVGFRPATPIEVGVQRFVDWYKGYYRINS